MDIIVLAAHGDDEVIGCGGTIRKLADAGHAVKVWYITAVHGQTCERDRAAKILGFEPCFCGYDPLTLAANVQGVNGMVQTVLDHAPDIVLCPPPDMHSDHRAVYEAALVACRANRANAPSLYAYEIGTTTQYNDAGYAWHPNTWVDITATIDAKCEAMLAYRSQLRTPPHPRNWGGLCTIARYRGLGAGCEYAEAFMLIHGHGGAL